jgi:acyl-CoA synthetase (AMP-forming)/AMP-acid ligase II
MDRWNADEAVRLADTGQWTHMAGATPFLEQLLAAARAAGTRLPGLKLFVCGGASVAPILIREAAAYFERAVVTRVYGSTEVPLTTVGSMDGDVTYAAETDGCAGITEIKLAGHPAALPGEGEIRARGPQMFVGYLHAEDEKDAFDDEGYFRTGDLGRWAGDSRHLAVTGRAKDIIIRLGENISPKEVEDILVQHPDIAEIAIVGIPDKHTGERACAVIVPVSPQAPTLSSIRDFLEAQGVARFKIPEQVILQDVLPRNGAGKVLKDRIRASIAGQVQPEASSHPHAGTSQANLPRISCTRLNNLLVRLIREKSCKRSRQVCQDFSRGVPGGEV